jgi:hypothetical protein
LATTVLLNRGGRFVPAHLPREVQFAPAMGVCVADMDGDGNEDIYFAQNFFPVNPEASRMDAGRGLWLKGDGKGGFTAVQGQESGILVYGEQRGCAVGDFDSDGRTDLVTTQNGAATKLYRNVGAKPGLRVRLKGAAGNEHAIGATLRLRFGDRQGAAREIHAGSGYWSQDSVVQVMSTPEEPTQIWIHWPGGSETTSDVPKGAKEVWVDGSGAITQKR